MKQERAQAGEEAILEWQRKIQVLQRDDDVYVDLTKGKSPTRSRIRTKIEGHKILLGAAKSRTLVKTADGFRIKTQSR